MSLQADPYALRYAASRFSAGAGELRRNASLLLAHKSQLVSHDWNGTASQAFDVQSEHQATYLRQTADILEQAASVLNSLASQVERVMELQRQAEQYERASWEYDGDTLDDLHHRQNLARQAAYYRQQAESEARQADSMASGQIHQIMAMIPNTEAQMGHGGGIHALDDDLDALPESMRSYYRRHSELREDGAQTSSVSETDLHLTPEQARRARKEEALLKEIEKEQKPSSIEDLLMLYYITKRDYHDTPELDQLIMDDLRLDGIKNEEDLREHIKKQIEINRYNEEWEKRCTAPENANDRDCITYRAFQGGGMDPGSLAVASGLAAQILTPAIKRGLSKVKELIFANAGESVKVALPGGGSIKVGMVQASGKYEEGHAKPSNQAGSQQSNLNEFGNTTIFSEMFMEHVFHGEVNKKGKAVGYHHESMMGGGEIVVGTESVPNVHGVYTAEIKVDGIPKPLKSTFFPKDWSRVQVLEAIKQAYQNRVNLSGNRYEGFTSDGIKIRMFLDKDNKIISAFPIY